MKIHNCYLRSEAEIEAIILAAMKGHTKSGILVDKALWQKNLKYSRKDLSREGPRISKRIIL